MTKINHSISIIDQSGIQHSLNFDFREHQIQNLYYEVRKIIKELFEEKAEMISALFPQKPLSFSVHLEQEKAENSGVVLACFDAGKSEDNDFYFHVYYSLIARIAQYIIEPNNQRAYAEISNVVLHELIHAADLSMLKENISITKSGYKLYGTDNFSMLRDVKSPNYKWDIQSALLRYFQIFRNEGVAILGEYLLLGQVNPFNIRNMEEVIAEFRSNLRSIFKLCEGMAYYNDFEQLHAYHMFKDLGNNAYQMSDLILLELLKTEHPEAKGNLDVIIHKLSVNEPIELSKSETIDLLKMAMQLDLSEYVQAILNNVTLNDEDVFPKQQLFRCCAIIQNEQPQEQVTKFAQNIGACGYNKDSKMFVELLKDILGCKMNHKELFDGHKLYMIKQHAEDIFQSIQVKVEQLFPLALKDNEIAVWALTYLFDDQDYIHDELPITGLQDDWMVLDAAVKILG